MDRTILTGIICLFASSIGAQTLPARGATCVSTGVVEVTATIRLTGGTFDGGCKTYIPGPGMEATSHSETDAARALLFRLENGARLRNVIIDRAPRTWTARAFTIYAGAVLENVRINYAHGDSYISIRSAGTVDISAFTGIGSVALDRHINAIGIHTSVSLSNCVVTNARKVYRQNGGTTYPTTASISACDISNMSDEIFRTDSSVARAVLSNSRLTNVKAICRGYAPGKCIVQPTPVN
jgi:pectate lyase-like protein